MEIVLISLLIIFGYMTLWFIVSTLKKRSDIADTAWGLGFTVLAWSLFSLDTKNQLLLLASLLVSIWGLRLSLHIYMRNRKKLKTIAI